MKMIFVGALSCLSLSVFAAVNPCADVPHSQIQRDPVTHTFTGCKVMKLDADSLYSDLGIQVGDVLQPDPPSKMKIKDMEAALPTEELITE